jgi:phosphotransferase system HPr-like phosphotransfer protein
MARHKKKKVPRTRRSTVPALAAEPLERFINEQEFLPLMAGQAQPFFRIGNYLMAAPVETWGENHMFSLSTEANALESFLDDFNARDNRTFSHFTELLASVRGFANAAHSLHHLKRRLSKYGVNAETDGKFVNALKDAVDWTTHSIEKLLKELYKEAEARKFLVGREAIGEARLPSAFARLRLPRDIDDEDVADETQRIAELATKYLKICDVVDSIGIEIVDDPVRLRHFVAKNCTEEKARQYETSVHNLQSKYDTYIKNTSYESHDPNLKALRGFISITLHLLEYVTHLVHFYERHENDIRYEPTKQRIARTIVKGEVLDHAVNFSLYYAAQFLRRGRDPALAIFPEYTKLREQSFDVPTHVELHLRPATLIHKVATHYGTPVQMRLGEGEWIDVSSLIRVVMEIGMNSGARSVTFRGDDKALRDLERLFENGFGERGEPLPRELPYLQ